MSTTTIARPASDKQIAFAARLASEKAFPEGFAPLAVDVMDSKAASAYIDWLMRLDRKPTVADDGDALAPGLFVQDGETYKVQASRQSGNLYAKVLVRDEDYPEEPGTWEYAPGAIRRLAGARRLSLDEAAAYGKQTGTCMVCSRTLTVKASIDAGIGPKCAGRL